MDILQGSLSAERCRSLLATGHVGRLVFTRHAMPAVVALHYAVVGSLVTIQAQAADDWPSRVDGTVVAFEVDETDTRQLIAWSVVVTGKATRTEAGVQLDLTRCVVTGSELAPLS